MSDKTEQGDEVRRDEETMARLLRLAGPRDPIPDDIEARVYERVQQEWRAASERPDGSRVYPEVHRQWTRNVPRSRVRRWAVPAALAATVVLAISVAMRPPPAEPIRVPVGSIARILPVDGGSDLPTPGQPVFPGDRLSTGSGEGLSLRLRNAESLRLDEQTSLVVSSGHEFRLAAGRIYADTGDLMFRDNGLVIETEMGSVTDVGTQFAVAVTADHIDVAVREGRVDVTRDAEEFVAVAGERMQIDSDGAASVDALAPHDSYWDWAASLAPTFDIENKSLLDFLRWAARETGRELVFANNELRMSAMRTDLHGSIADVEPLDAIASVLATTRFKYRIETDRIIIEQ